MEAARLARAAVRRVKVVWTREEEFTWAYFRPAGVIEIKSGIASDGALTAWEFHNYHSGASGIETPYVVVNERTEYHQVPLILRSGSYRGLAATANHFAREMIDRKSTRLNSSHGYISYAVFCLKKKKRKYDMCHTAHYSIAIQLV